MILSARFTRGLLGGDDMVGTKGSTAGSMAMSAEDEVRRACEGRRRKGALPFDAPREIRQHFVDYDVLALASFM